jgi:tetratricopeptide (TPR) repeat protein
MLNILLLQLSNDETWRTLHEHAMKNSWKPPTTATDSKQDTALGDRMSESMPMQQYKFEVDNPYLLKSSASGATTGALSDGLSSSTPQLTSDDMFEKGMQYYAEGHVDEAILAFEASVQSHPENVDNVTVSENIEFDTAVDEIWNMLGKCHAEMDKDTSAIFCLQQALEYDPFNLPALLALGTCHVNEMNPMEALECLQGWVKHNPKFHGLEAKMKKQYNTDSADDVYADGTLMDEVLQLMLAVANFDPTDTDVQVVLGVVQNVTQDLDAAAGAFQKALHQNPQDFSLLNKVRVVYSCNHLPSCYSYYVSVIV